MYRVKVASVSGTTHHKALIYYAIFEYWIHTFIQEKLLTVLSQFCTPSFYLVKYQYFIFLICQFQMQHEHKQSMYDNNARLMNLLTIMTYNDVSWYVSVVPVNTKGVHLYGALPVRPYFYHIWGQICTNFLLSSVCLTSFNFYQSEQREENRLVTRDRLSQPDSSFPHSTCIWVWP